MKKLCKILGTYFLGLAALVVVLGPASINSVAVEEMPASMKSER